MEKQTIYYLPTSVEEAVALQLRHQGTARWVAGGTDLMAEQGNTHCSPSAYIDITRIPELCNLQQSDGQIVFGAAVPHAQIGTSDLIRRTAFLLAQASSQIGSPQIRNTGTIGGNLATTSAAGDILPVLAVLDAQLVIADCNGRQDLPFDVFMLGNRKNALNRNQMIVAVRFDPLPSDWKSCFIKFGLRQGYSISLASAAVVLNVKNGRIEAARIATGAVSARVERIHLAEEYLIGKPPAMEVFKNAAEIAAQAASPIDDIRSSAEYRRGLVRVLVSRGLEQAANGESEAGFSPFVLGKPFHQSVIPVAEGEKAIKDVHCTVNGKPVVFSNAVNSTLLDALRKIGGMTGTKNGCAQGECGACTVLLDEKAVLACLTPAGAAHKRSIRVVEGLELEEQLNALQQAFIDAGAVHCGYCTPGFLMSATALLENYPSPSRELIREAISGNICRCTGYKKIVDAIEMVAAQGEVK